MWLAIASTISACAKRCIMMELAGYWGVEPRSQEFNSPLCLEAAKAASVALGKPHSPGTSPEEGTMSYFWVLETELTWQNVLIILITEDTQNVLLLLYLKGFPFLNSVARIPQHFHSVKDVVHSQILCQTVLSKTVVGRRHKCKPKINISWPPVQEFLPPCSVRSLGRTIHLVVLGFKMLQSGIFCSFVTLCFHTYMKKVGSCFTRTTGNIKLLSI